jgi:hypothetical protein
MPQCTKCKGTITHGQGHSCPNYNNGAYNPPNSEFFMDFVEDVLEMGGELLDAIVDAVLDDD